MVPSNFNILKALKAITEALKLSRDNDRKRQTKETLQTLLENIIKFEAKFPYRPADISPNFMIRLIMHVMIILAVQLISLSLIMISKLNIIAESIFYF